MYSVVHMYMLCVYYYCQHVIIIVSLFQEGNTCLHFSSNHATADTVALIISKGADVNSTNNVSIISVVIGVSEPTLVVSFGVMDMTLDFTFTMSLQPRLSLLDMFIIYMYTLASISSNSLCHVKHSLATV